MDMEVSSESHGGTHFGGRNNEGRKEGTANVPNVDLNSGANDMEATDVSRQNCNKVDLSGDDDVGGGKLKRSCSAPMINQLIPQQKVTTPPVLSRGEVIAAESGTLQPRPRRFSATFSPFSPLFLPQSPSGSTNCLLSSGCLTSSRPSSRMRVKQLKEEEGMDVVNREVAHERELQSSLQMARSLSQSCEELALDDDHHRKREPRLRADYSDPLHLNIGLAATSLSCGPSPCGAASPTRTGRQCFSPSLQQCVRSSPFTPSPSKRPSAFVARRSLSPITPRSSPLRTLGPSNLSACSTKRKCEEDEGDEFAAPSKRLSVGGVCEGSLLMTRPTCSDSQSNTSFNQSSLSLSNSFSSNKLNSSDNSSANRLDLNGASGQRSSSSEDLTFSNVINITRSPFYIQSNTRDSTQESSNPFLRSSSPFSVSRTSPFHCVSSATLTINNPFLRTEHQNKALHRTKSPQTERSFLLKTDRHFSSGRETEIISTTTNNGVTATLGVSNQHLFRPVSPAAVNASMMDRITPMASAPGCSVARMPRSPVSEAMVVSEDEHQEVSGKPNQQSLSSCIYTAMLKQHEYSSSASDGSSSSGLQHRHSLDSNKSFQDMDLSEDSGNHT